MSVMDFAAEGPLPGEAVATTEELDRRERQLHQIEPPVSEDEARILLTTFGVDDCFGLSLHLRTIVESAPVVPLERQPDPDDNYWLHDIWDRVQRRVLSEAVRRVGFENVDPAVVELVVMGPLPSPVLASSSQLAKVEEAVVRVRDHARISAKEQQLLALLLATATHDTEAARLLRDLVASR